MPRYVFQCPNGHETVAKMGFKEYEEIREHCGGNAEIPCLHEYENDLCYLPAPVQIQPVPFSFWRGDSDVSHSIKKFGMGNLGEV